jgi:NAD(P)H-dependent FMN reductase
MFSYHPESRIRRSTRMPKLGVIIASTRPGRVGLPVAEWFQTVARDHSVFDLDVLDLAEIALPLMDEPNHPRLERYTNPHTVSWSARVDACDAFVLVMPEYNYGFTAPLKNAIDYLHNEWSTSRSGSSPTGGSPPVRGRRR